MNENKWIKLHSKLLNWGWYKNKNTKILFIHCLLKANWKEGIFEGVTIPRGSFATSIQSLMKELDMSKQEIRTALKHLNSTYEITQAQYPKFTVITIVNYELYQQSNTTFNNQLTQEQHSSNTGATPIEEYKNIDYIDNNNTTATNNKTGETIFDLVQKEFGRVLSPMELEIITSWNAVFSDDLLLYAVRESIMCGARSLKYTQRILERYKRENIKTVVEAQELQIACETKSAKESVELFDYDWLNENE